MRDYRQSYVTMMLPFTVHWLKNVGDQSLYGRNNISGRDDNRKINYFSEIE